MTAQTKYVLNTINSAINGESFKPSSDFSVEALLELAQKHKITTMVYYGLFNSEIQLPPEIKKQLQMIVAGEVMIDQKQLGCVKEISQMFSQKGIDHMLLKGSVLKHIYPKTEIRRMGDIDILIREEQYDKAADIMQELGFSFQTETGHELIWTKGNIMVELQKAMMPPHDKDFLAYFGNGWKRALPLGNSVYAFSDEDTFIYLFAHFAKHYRDSGIGIIHMCDLYLYLKNKSLNFEYVYSELKKLGLYEFYLNVKNTVDVWFDDRESDEITDHITTVIFNSGVYGLHENNVVSAALKKKRKFNANPFARLHYYIRRFFPSYTGMKTKYQILKKAPALLPFFWVCRWFELAFIKRDHVKNVLHEQNAATDKKIFEYEQALKYVGLDYNF